MFEGLFKEVLSSVNNLALNVYIDNILFSDFNIYKIF